MQVAGAEKSMLAHFEGLNETRRKSAPRDRLFNEVLSSTFHNVVNIGMGLILLLGVLRCGQVRSRLVIFPCLPTTWPSSPI